MTKKPNFSWKFLFVFASVIVLLAGLLRFANLNSLPVFVDEAIYVRWAQVMRAESTLRFLPLSDGKQPLYMWSVIPFLKIFADPLIAGRVTSVLAGFGTLFGVGLAAWLLFRNLRLSLIASLLYAILPYAVFFDRMALSDSLLSMFIIWAFNFLLLAVRHTRNDYAMLAGFALGFAWLTKSPAMFAFLLLPLLLLEIKPGPGFKISLFKSLFLILICYVIAFAMYNILRLGPEFHMIAIRNKDYVYPLSEILRHPLNPLLPHLRDSALFFLSLATPVGLLLGLFGLLGTRLEHWRQRLILAAWWLIPIFAQSFVAITLTARYLLFTIPFFCILTAHALEHLGNRTQKHLLIYAGLALVIIPALYQDSAFIFKPQLAILPRIERAGYLEEWTSGYGLKDISQYIASASQASPVIVGSEGFFGTPFSALEMYLNSRSNTRIVGVGTWIDSVSPKLTSALAENQVFLVVNSSRFSGNPDRLGLKLINSYPKAVPPNGHREYTLFFRVLPRP